MTSFWLLFGVAILGGVAVVVQSQFMGTLNEKMGVATSVFITYGSGGLLIALWMLLQRGGQWAGGASVPWYAWSTGLLGLFIVGSIAYATPRLGLVITFTVMLASQFLLAALLDHNGWLGAAVRPVDWSRMLGLVVMLFGVWLTVR
jgi:bacterial/archaeal transporter family-2 protein